MVDSADNEDNEDIVDVDTEKEEEEEEEINNEKKNEQELANSIEINNQQIFDAAILALKNNENTTLKEKLINHIKKEGKITSDIEIKQY
jgi:hypothetical protein